MKTYYVSDEDYKNSKEYQDYLIENPGSGNLRVRTYAARGAIPISDVKITITKEINGNEVVFFEGMTNESGLIERITLPAPKISVDDTIIPAKATYTLKAMYEKDNVNNIYEINMYDGICVVQNIHIAYTMNKGDM